jgi:hypothetical protein
VSRSSSDLIDAIEREASGPHNETTLEMNGRLQRIIGLCRELRSVLQSRDSRSPDER